MRKPLKLCLLDDLKQYLKLFDLFDQVVSGLVAGLQLHVEVIHPPLRLLALQLYPLSQLDLLFQCPLLINELTRDLHTCKHTHR